MTSKYEQKDCELIAHLLRRASFGAGKEAIEICAENGYSKNVQELLYPSKTKSIRIN